MNSRIKIKMGSIELEGEGSEDFLKNDLLVLVEAALALYQKMGLVDHEAGAKIIVNNETLTASPSDRTASQNSDIAAQPLKLRVSHIDDINAYLNYDVRALLMKGYADWQINDVLAGQCTLSDLLIMGPESNK